MEGDSARKPREGSESIGDASVDRVVSLVRKYGILALALLPALAVSAGLYRSHERAEAQIAAFSQVTRDCLKKALSDKGVPDGVCESLNEDELSEWASCVEQGKKDQNLDAYPFVPDEEVYSEAVQSLNL